jgi:hypothetical protein
MRHSFVCASANARTLTWVLNMERIRIVTDISKHVGCGGLMAMSQEAPEYIVEHEGLETTIPGVEMVCLRCGERIRSQDQVETPGE